MISSQPGQIGGGFSSSQTTTDSPGFGTGFGSSGITHYPSSGFGSSGISSNPGFGGGIGSGVSVQPYEPGFGSTQVTSDSSNNNMSSSSFNQSSY